MKFLSLIAIGLCFIAGAAMAQIDPQFDGIGIYADVDGMLAGVQQEVGVPLEVYLLLTNPSSDLMYMAWECGIDVPDNALVWGFNFPHPGTIAIIDGTDFTAAWGVWTPMQSVNLLMTFIITPLDDQCAYFGVTGNSGTPDPVGPAYCVEGYQIVDLHPYSGAAGAAFALNADEMLATDSATLDQVKALYR